MGGWLQIHCFPIHPSWVVSLGKTMEQSLGLISLELLDALKKKVLWGDSPDTTMEKSGNARESLEQDQQVINTIRCRRHE